VSHRDFRGPRHRGQGRCDQPYYRPHKPARLPGRRIARPSDREKTQVYIQRCITHFPAAGEIIQFDRSWCNRAGVECVMGFCTDEEDERFLAVTPVVEREIAVNMGIILRKYFLDVSQDEQRRRFEARIKDPVKHWKLSPMDTESVQRWWDYTAAYQRMIEATHAGRALVHRASRQQAPRPAEPDPASARQHTLQEDPHRLAENPQGAAAAQGR
jgi:hypothetical protein